MRPLSCWLSMLPRPSRCIRKLPVLALLLSSLGNLPAAQAALFSDDEARRAILELRTKSDAQNQQILALQELVKKLESTQRGQFEVINQLEQLRQDNAKLRGQLETLSHDLAETQRRQKDLFVNLENRLVKLEPQAVTIDGKEVRVEQKETEAFEHAQALFKNGDFKGAVSAINIFQKTYPHSAYTPQSQYLLGNAYYASRDFKQTVIAQQQLVKEYPTHPKAADALLTMASAQIELNDKKSAKKTLETLTAKYPDSPAAITAKERLKALK